MEIDDYGEVHDGIVYVGQRIVLFKQKIFVKHMKINECHYRIQVWSIELFKNKICFFLDLNTSPKSRSTNRTRSLVLHDNTEVEQPQTESQDESSISVKNSASPELSTNKHSRSDENILETVAVSPPQKRELHTRNGRRVRCNGLIWKHLCADKKTTSFKRKYQRQSVPIEKPDPMPEIDQNTSDKLSALSSDTIHTSSPITRNSKKRKTTGDITNEEHIVPKRRAYRRRGKGISLKTVETI